MDTVDQEYCHRVMDAKTTKGRTLNAFGRVLLHAHSQVMLSEVQHNPTSI